MAAAGARTGLWQSLRTTPTLRKLLRIHCGCRAGRGAARHPTTTGGSMKHAHLFVALTAFSALTMTGLATAQPSAPASPMPAGQAAADQGDKPMPSFEDLDTKGHGYLVRGDLPKDVPGLSKLRQHLSEADTNHDGRISKSEYDAYVVANGPDAQAHH
jgi:hypothetical protein